MNSLILAGIWVVLAQIIAVLPSRDRHWRAAYILISIGVPVLAFVIWENGFWVGLLVLFAAMSILRWPVYYAWRWTMRRLRLSMED